jgi:hypothetical protein
MSQSLTRQEGAALLAKKPKRSKYNAKRVMAFGIEFHSAKEANRYVDLRRKQDAGLISHLELQPKFFLYGRDSPILIKSKGYPNGRLASFRADFGYFCFERNKRIIEDVKGFRTPVFILKKAIVEACYPGVEIIEI